MAELLTIGQVAHEVGVATSALRYYEERGLVAPTTRVSGQRRYDRQVLARLRIVELCPRAGFTLAEIEQLLHGAGDWRPFARDRLTELDERIRQLQDARRLVQTALECDCDHLEGCDDITRRTPAPVRESR